MVFPFQPFLHHIHVEKAKEAAAETETQGLGRFRHKFQRRIVELKFFQCFLQIVIILAFDGIEAAENHGERLSIPRQRFGGAVFGGGNGIPHFAVLYILNAGCHIAHGAAGQDVAGLGEGGEIAHLRHRVHLAGGHHADIHARFDFPVHNAHIGNGTLVGIENGIKNQTAQRLFRIVRRRRHLLHNPLQHLFHIFAGFGGNGNGIGHVKADDVFHFLLHPVDVRAGKVDFINDRNDFQVMVQSQVHIGQSLGLHPLGGINDKDSSFAGGKTAGYFIIKIHMAWGVDQVQFIGIAVFILVHEPHGLLLNGDAPFPLQIHGVQNLGFHVPLLHRTGKFDKPIRQGGLAVVDMGNN